MQVGKGGKNLSLGVIWEKQSETQKRLGMSYGGGRSNGEGEIPPKKKEGMRQAGHKESYNLDNKVQKSIYGGGASGHGGTRDNTKPEESEGGCA